MLPNRTADGLVGFLQKRLAFLSSSGANLYWQRIYDCFGNEGVRAIVQTEHTGMGVVAGLLVTVTVSALLASPQALDDNDFNEAATYCYIVFMLLSTWLNLSAICIAFEVIHNVSKAPVDQVFKIVMSFKGSLHTEAYLHIYLGCYSLWAGVCSSIYLQYGATMFFISIGFGVMFIGHVTLLTNQMFGWLHEAYSHEPKATLTQRTSNNSVVPLLQGQVAGSP